MAPGASHGLSGASACSRCADTGRWYTIELRYKLSWWDSMIVAAAQLQECALLLTEDLQDGAAFGTVTVRSPFTLDVREAGAKYDVQRLGAPLHRPRGRPRRSAMTAL